MPLTKPDHEPGDLSSRLFRTLRRTNTASSAGQSASKGKAKAIERESLTLGRTPRPVRNAGSACESKASSSRTTLVAEGQAPESRRPKRHRTSQELTTALETSLSSALSNSNADIPAAGAERAAVSTQPTESTFLVQKIRGLVNSLPPALSSRFLPSTKDPPPPTLDSDGCPIPPPGAIRIQDSDLISLLSNPDVMNGSEGKRRSVWSMLEAIKPPGDESSESPNEDYEYAGSDRSSVMMYSPLIPTLDSVIELADLEEVPVAQSDSSSAPWFFASWPDWSALWPFNGSRAQDVSDIVNNPDIAIPARSPNSPTISVPEIAGPESSPGERRAAPAQRVWVPSTTQLSFETTWWGYRIYLPPPVLEILDDQSVEAAQQATTITAALSWFFSNLPISTFPPPVQPAMILLQRLIPLGSYLGTFISWSWSTIRAFDRGHGVILTATWLLPIALIPGTWHVRDVPPSSPAPEVVEIPLQVVATETPDEPPLPPAPAPATIPLPPVPDEPPFPPPVPKQRKGSSSGKSKIKTLRKLTRTFTNT